jgi:hypothetical protein
MPFQVATLATVNNDARVAGSFAVNGAGMLRLGKHVRVTDGSMIVADHLHLGNDTSIYGAMANFLYLGRNVDIRDGIRPPATPPLPLTDPYCPIPAVDCGGPDVIVGKGETVGPLAPGSYGRILVQAGGRLVVAPGSVNACSITLARAARVETRGASRLAIAGGLRLGSGAYVGPAIGEPHPTVMLAGTSIRLSQEADLAAQLLAPNAHMTLGRHASVQGCFQVGAVKTDKHIRLECAMQ